MQVVVSPNLAAQSPHATPGLSEFLILFHDIRAEYGGMREIVRGARATGLLQVGSLGGSTWESEPIYEIRMFRQKKRA